MKLNRIQKKEITSFILFAGKDIKKIHKIKKIFLKEIENLKDVCSIRIQITPYLSKIYEYEETFTGNKGKTFWRLHYHHSRINIHKKISWVKTIEVKKK